MGAIRQTLDPTAADLIDSPTLATLMATLETFCPIEVNILSYEESKGSNIASHFDDFWLWGERIIGVNLLSDTVMTYTNPSDPTIML